MVESTTAAMCGLWEHLFEDLEGYYLATLTGKQTWRAGKTAEKPNGLVYRQQRFWQWPEEMYTATEYLLEQSDKGRDVYFGVHLFETPDSREGVNAAPQILSLWVDGDGAEVPKDWPQPSAIVESSPGRHHYYWKLTRPIAPEQAAQLNKRLVYGMDGDKGKWGLGTVLRPPGTRNYKRAIPSEVTGVVYV